MRCRFRFGKNLAQTSDHGVETGDPKAKALTAWPRGRFTEPES